MALNIPREDLDHVVEERKDRLNLKPELDFVIEHLADYRAGLARLLARPIDPRSAEIAGRVEFCDYDQIDLAGQRRQLSPDLAIQILKRMPASLLALSQLGAVVYSDNVPVPNFASDGAFEGGTEWVKESDFLEKVGNEELHPSRILVGVSNGEIIWSTPIPSTVCEDDEAVSMYQIHVFLHEFFHTVERGLRQLVGQPIEDRPAEISEDEVKSRFLNLCGLFMDEVRGGYFRPVSRYSSTYEETLLAEGHRNHDAYRQALAEEMCETFVAYQLGLVPPSSEPTSRDPEYLHKSKENIAKRLRIMQMICNEQGA